MAEQNQTAYALPASDLVLRAAADGVLELSDGKWPAWSIGGLTPRLRLRDQEWMPESAHLPEPGGKALRIEYTYACKAHLVLTFKIQGVGLSLDASLVNTGLAEIVLQEVTLLATGRFRLDEPHETVRVFTQGNYSGRVVSLAPPPPAPPASDAPAGEPNAAPAEAQHGSDLVSVVYSRTARRAFLTGFETSERWFGQIRIVRATDGNLSYRVCFDGGDLAVNPGEELALESAVFLSGSDPWALLETYAPPRT